MARVKEHFSHLTICPRTVEYVFMSGAEIACLTHHSKGHVAIGAVLVRAATPFITRRPILRSKAVTTFLPVTNAIRSLPIYDKLFIQRDDRKGEEWYYTAQWLAKKVYLDS